MPKTLEQRMTDAGWTAQELADVAPMLNNAKFRQTIETQLNNAETIAEQNAKLNKDLDSFENWFQNDIAPTHQQALKAAEDARAAQAAAEARLKVIQERGLKAQGQQQDPAAMAEADRAAAAAAEAARNAGKDPMKGYVNEETFNRAFESTGDAIADAIDLGVEYHNLYGNTLNMKQMRLEAKAAKLPVRAYVERKFNFDQKRQEMATKAEQDREAKIRQDERQKVMVEFGGSNPNMNTLRPSQSPLMNRKRADGDKQPWEVSENERTSKRVERAYIKAVERGEVATA